MLHASTKSAELQFQLKSHTHSNTNTIQIQSQSFRFRSRGGEQSNRGGEQSNRWGRGLILPLGATTGGGGRGAGAAVGEGCGRRGGAPGGGGRDAPAVRSSWRRMRKAWTSSTGGDDDLRASRLGRRQVSSRPSPRLPFRARAASSPSYSSRAGLLFPRSKASARAPTAGAKTFARPAATTASALA